MEPKFGPKLPLLEVCGERLQELPCWDASMADRAWAWVSFQYFNHFHKQTQASMCWNAATPIRATRLQAGWQCRLMLDVWCRVYVIDFIRIMVMVAELQTYSCSLYVFWNCFFIWFAVSWSCTGLWVLERVHFQFFWGSGCSRRLLAWR